MFDLSEEAPDKSLSRVYVNLEKLKLDGDEFATKIEEKLRIIVSRPFDYVSLFCKIKA